MSAVLVPADGQRPWRGRLGSAGLVLALHGLLALVLLRGLAPALPEPPLAMMVETALVSLPPAPVPEPLVEPLVEPVAEIEPPAPRVEEAPPPLVRPDQAELAFKRAERERETQRREQEAEHRRQERLEQQRRAQQQQEAQRQAQLAARQAAEREAALAAERARAADSRRYQPLSKKAPAYPQRALDQRLEGTCTVTYTVDARGRVQAPEALDDCHPLFVRPSLAAARGFRYQPRLVDGQAVPVANVRNTFHYRIE
ncbi:energy transducer TonB [Stutzerimonas kirkiae]|uniref:Protein TonB n=1 Tax=Stutzerimonas kirkiae TaxID=2211392 RepID=A0A4Q9RDK3_9GAMM|nr:energy transducer TonB [Stutzerimonas kirkiae]TBU98582.1 energy transducer TonB [Stutzerimonas kirkiae]TBV04244.1 energy transducer TonB [Stutzerimonas kirkiae]